MAAAKSRAGRLHVLYLAARTVLIAGLGGLAFQFLDFPAPLLSGAMVAVAIATLSGVVVSVPPLLREIVFFVLGVSIGSALTPETISGVAVWPLSIFLLCLTAPAVTLGAGALLIWGRGWRRDDALLACAPGALSMVLIVADSIGANVPKVALAQTLRLAILVVLLPPMVGVFSDLAPVPAIGASLSINPVDLLLVVAGALAGALVARLIRLPAPMLIGAMAGSGLLYGSGLITSPIPDAILLPGLVVVGAYIGTRFSGMTLSSIRAGLVDGLIAFAAAFAITTGMAALVTFTLGLSFGQTVLAFAPGGFEVMIVLAFSLGLDAAYVALHQTTRFFVIAVAIPIVYRKRVRQT